VSTIKGRLFESRSRLRRSLVACGVRDEAREAGERGEYAERWMAARRRIRRRPERTVMSETRGLGSNRMGVGDHLRVEVDVDEIAREAERFITERWPRPKPRETLDELGSPRNRFLSIEVLESMVLDGASGRQDVRPFVEWCLAEWGRSNPTAALRVHSALPVPTRGSTISPYICPSSKSNSAAALARRSRRASLR